MFRRNFLTSATLGLAGATVNASTSRMVTYRITGFTCVTCAVGLDTLLSRQKGVVRSHSSYPDATAAITYNPDLIDETRLKGFIAELGFTATVVCLTARPK